MALTNLHKKFRAAHVPFEGTPWRERTIAQKRCYYAHMQRKSRIKLSEKRAKELVRKGPEPDPALVNQAMSLWK